MDRKVEVTVTNTEFHWTNHYQNNANNFPANFNETIVLSSDDEDELPNQPRWQEWHAPSPNSQPPTREASRQSFEVQTVPLSLKVEPGTSRAGLYPSAAGLYPTETEPDLLKEEWMSRAGLYPTYTALLKEQWRTSRAGPYPLGVEQSNAPESVFRRQNLSCGRNVRTVTDVAPSTSRKKNVNNVATSSSDIYWSVSWSSSDNEGEESYKEDPESLYSPSESSRSSSGMDEGASKKYRISIMKQSNSPYPPNKAVKKPKKNIFLPSEETFQLTNTMKKSPSMGEMRLPKKEEPVSEAESSFPLTVDLLSVKQEPLSPADDSLTVVEDLWIKQEPLDDPTEESLSITDNPLSATVDRLSPVDSKRRIFEGIKELCAKLGRMEDPLFATEVDPCIIENPQLFYSLQAVLPTSDDELSLTEYPLFKSTEPIFTSDALAETTQNLLFNTEDALFQAEDSLMMKEDSMSETDEPLFKSTEPLTMTDDPLFMTEDPLFESAEPLTTMAELPSTMELMPEGSFFTPNNQASTRKIPSSIRKNPFSIVEGPLFRSDEPIFMTGSPAHVTEDVQLTIENLRPTTEELGYTSVNLQTSVQ